MKRARRRWARMRRPTIGDGGAAWIVGGEEEHRAEGLGSGAGGRRERPPGCCCSFWRPAWGAPFRAGRPAARSAATWVELTWTGASDHTSLTTVWRKRAPGPGDFIRIALVSGSQTGYTDQTVDPETAYGYRVRAETNYYRSDWSNE